jgi:hypothetical protein
MLVLICFVFSGLCLGGYLLCYFDPSVGFTQGSVLTRFVELVSAIHIYVCLDSAGAICKLS